VPADRVEGGGDPPRRVGEGARDVARLALHAGVEHHDVGHRTGGTGTEDLHVVGHGRHCRPAASDPHRVVAYLRVAG
jgi:hypothetical protein